MSAFIRILLLLVAAGLAAPPSAAAQASPGAAAEVPADVKTEVLQRFRVLVISDGVVLTPRSGSDRTIEIRNNSIAIDGTGVSGSELRDRLGADADVVLRLSYVAPEALRAAFTAPAAPAAPAPPGAPAASAPPAAPASPAAPEPPAPPAEPEREWRRKSGAKVSVLGSVEVDEDERATEAVVAVIGNVTVKGRVEDDVVAVLGDVHLGPRAVVTGSVTSVGGRIEQEPGAEIHGDVNEVRLRHGGWHGAGVGWRPWMDTREMFSGWFGLMGTLLRIALVMLLTLIVAIAASSPVERISRRAGSDPWVSGFVGLAAQVLFVPVLVVTVVFLAISIIGIPLLLLVPFALVALLFGVLMGFTGVARRVGEWAVGPYKGPLVAITVGVAVITAAAVVTRILWLIPGPTGPLAFAVWLIALFIEYIAWTVGLGALLLTRFGTRGPSTVTADVVPPPVPPPLPAEG
ncbi:MAG TPA: polymer-forming cytoskeletal protein [Vicinamibacterales bacterium]|nr:polymer-forming cytoskeletal protein [Vicinamibacterales bacterium]